MGIADNNRKVLIETLNIRLQLIEYLQNIKKYLEEERYITYSDDSYVYSSLFTLKACTDGSTKQNHFKKTASCPRSV